MKGPLVASGVAVVVAVYRLVNPIPAGERFIARATIEQIASSVVIPRGMRAVAVPVNEVVGVRRLVFPGMRVDVLISGTLPSGTGGPAIHTRTLLQDIEVLSAGQELQEGR